MKIQCLNLDEGLLWPLTKMEGGGGGAAAWRRQQDQKLSLHAPKDGGHTNSVLCGCIGSMRNGSLVVGYRVK